MTLFYQDAQTFALFYDKWDMACWFMAFAFGAVIAYVNYRHRLDALDLRGDPPMPHSEATEVSR